MRFHKYSSTGNDFIIINQEAEFPESLPKGEWVTKICQRKVSVGADGLILVKKLSSSRVQMTYFNNDGNEVEMCGNGLRAVGRYCVDELKFSSRKPINVKTQNGEYEVSVPNFLSIKIKMTEIDSSQMELAKKYDAYYLSVGVPHVVKSVDDLSIFPNDLALEIRHDPLFLNGTNVNFYEEISPGLIRVRTFERGVEGETLSCGTGVTASAIVYMQKTENHKIFIQTEGGQVVVSRVADEIFLEGPSNLVFIGTLL